MFTVPATIIKSACRGVARNAPAPNRSMSYRLAPAAIISIAQQANPNVSGQTLDCRAQLIACATGVVMTFSSNRPSIHGWKLSSLTCPPSSGLCASICLDQYRPNRTGCTEFTILYYDALGVKVH